MRKFTVEFKSLSPVSFSKAHQTQPLAQESHEAREERTWREKLHVNSDGCVIIPATMFKHALEEAASYAPIKKKGQSTFKKNILAGVLVVGEITLPLKKEQVQGETLFVPSDGKTGGSSRVFKTFPRIESWKGKLEVICLDDAVTRDVLEPTLDVAGKFIGIGRWRPIRGGNYGRFEHKIIKEEKE